MPTDPYLIGNPMGDYNPGQVDSSGQNYSVPTAVDGKPDIPPDSTLGQSKYNFGSRVFPSDLGSNSYNGHYIVININVQNSSNMTSVNGIDMSTPLPGEMSKTDALRFGIDAKYRGVDGSNYQQSKLTSRPRFTTRIAESIALYMPNSELVFTDVHDYDNVSLTAFGALVAGGAVKFGATAIGAFIGGIIGGKAGAMAGSQLGFGAGQLFNGTMQAAGSIAQIAGSPINPKIEVLYANTAQREFAFEFLMSPTSEEESRTIDEIVRIMRFHAAPELKGGGLGSFLYVPPSEFDITFYHRGEENTKIPRINTCALVQCDVSYAPAGVYSTFHNGYPVQVRMMLRFRETEVVHKLRVLQGF